MIDDPAWHVIPIERQIVTVGNHAPRRLDRAGPTHDCQPQVSCADRIASDAMADDEDGPAVVEDCPIRPNPVTQDEMDAGSIELF